MLIVIESVAQLASEKLDGLDILPALLPEHMSGSRLLFCRHCWLCGASSTSVSISRTFCVARDISLWFNGELDTKDIPGGIYVYDNDI